MSGSATRPETSRALRLHGLRRADDSRPDRTARATSSFENRSTYTGREWDPTLRLYTSRRWLEPKAGRFFGRDPLGYVDGLGLYGAYFADDGLDPGGLQVLANGADEEVPNDHHGFQKIQNTSYLQVPRSKAL